MLTRRRWPSSALGAAAGEDGTVLVITVGTGLGSGVHHAGRLVPGFELGLLPHPTRGGVLETQQAVAPVHSRRWTCRRGQTDSTRLWP
ncbi:MAG: hypothetical protein CM15mP18_0070 [Methanobacteriota archaeon]|nr:MAG: hypothetical protein CM15mP18_0070 [Euryarchaeota archaeon]